MFDSAKGGRQKLEALDSKVAGWSESTRTNELRKHARLHVGQMLRRAPLLPVHHFVFDIMHGVHNEANVLLDEAVHKHLMVDSPSPEVKKIIADAQEQINALWKAASLPKFIQFGRDQQGAHSHALNGPCFKAVWRKPDLLIKTIHVMKPVYDLLEAEKLTPALSADAVGEQADEGPAKKGGSKGKGKPKPKPKPRAPKNRGIAWDDEEVDAEKGVEAAAPPAADAG